MTPEPGYDELLALYELAPFGYLTADPDGRITSANRTFLEWTGYRRDEVVDRKRFVDLLSVGGRVYHETHYAPNLRMQGRTREIAFDLVCAGGERLPTLVNSVVEFDDTGEPSSVRIALLDARERRAYERELLEAKRRAEAAEASAAQLARTLQQTLIPPDLPEIAGLSIDARYRPAGTGDEIGGDFHDVFQVGVDDWVIAIGDVQGKGASAAVVTALTRYAIRAASVEHASPAEALLVVNDVMLRSHADRFCTVLLMRCRREGGTWRVTCSAGGHPLPVLVRPGAVAVDVGRPGTLLGMLRDATMHDADVTLAPGDVLVGYTDGVLEARGGGGFYGIDRLRRVLAHSGADVGHLLQAVLDDVLVFQNGDPRDDIDIVALAASPTP